MFDDRRTPASPRLDTRKPPGPSSMRGLLYRSTALVLAALIVQPARAAGEPGTPVPVPVRVTLWEALPESWDWQAPAGEPADAYDVPAMGFGRIPAKYSGRGIEVDRSNPFALHAETTLTAPA